MTKRFPHRRTALITAGGVAAVIVAGAFAVGANIGILHASSDNQIGALSAAGDLVPTSGDAPATTNTAPQTYFVDVAGTVGIDASGDTLVVSAVDANPGWTWKQGAADATQFELVFTDGVRSLLFAATRSADGSIDATVNETTSGPDLAATVTTLRPAHEDSDDLEEHEEHEGREDDD